MLKLYTYKNCDTCRKTKKYLAEKGVDYSDHPIRETPPNKSELKEMLGHYDGELRKLFNTSGQDYRQLGIKDKLKDMSKEQVIDLLHGNGNLVKRPFALGEGWGLVGFKVDEWQDKV